MDERSCRLCFESSTDPCLNIFSAIGVEMKMVEILSGHFQCEISQADQLPNAVCQVCWKTTEAFHKLYKKSKEVQEKFLNSVVKAEYDPFDILCPDNEKEGKKNSEAKGKSAEISLIKVEQSPQNSESDTEKLANDAIDSYDEVVHDGDINASDDESVDKISDTQNVAKSKKIKPMRRQRQSIKIDFNYQKLFSENKHLLNMTCDYCSNVFESLEEARDHYPTKHNIRRGYIKSIHGRKFHLRHRIIEYLARQSNPEMFKCMECDRMYSSMCRLEKHKKQHANESTENKVHDQFIADNFDMSCDLCEGTLFTSFHGAKRHYNECHNGEKGYVKCCNKKFKRLGDIREHINKHLNPEMFKCEMCGKRLSTLHTLQNHRREMHHRAMENLLICDYCGKSLRGKQKMECHMFAKHLKCERKFECEICQKKFAMPLLLKNHMNSVHKNKDRCITCEICGKSFYTNCHLNIHMLTHSDKTERLAMRTQCEHCGEWLLTRSGIYYHKQLHSKAIHKCDDCGMELSTRPALLTHIRDRHRAHKYKCNYCDKTFSIASTLREHEVSHTRHKIYQCNVCPKVFTVPSSRRTHVRRNHPEELKKSYNKPKKIT